MIRSGKLNARLGCFAVIVAAGLAAIGCGGDDEPGKAPDVGGAPDGANGTGGGPGASGGPGTGGSGPGTGGVAGTGGGPGAGGGDGQWQRAFVEASFNPKKVGEHSCETSAEALAASKLARVSANGSTMYVGFHQVSGDNQDPFAARVDGDRVAWCVYHENDPPDGRALGLAWDGGPVAYVVYTIVGGGTDLEMAGWFRSYGGHAGIAGGGKKVGVLGRVDAVTGALTAATHLPAVLEGRKLNSHAPADAPLVLASGQVEYRGSSAHKPLGADGKNPMGCTDYPFDTTYRFSPDLAALACATSTNCVENTLPCL